MDDVIEDKRFSHIAKDPRFRRIPRKDKKVKIDSRFKGMFTDKQFKIKSSVDKRGRKIVDSSRENLRRFYEVSESDDSDKEAEDSFGVEGMDDTEIKQKRKNTKGTKDKVSETIKSSQTSTKIKMSDAKVKRQDGSKQAKQKPKLKAQVNNEEEDVSDDDDDDDVEKKKDNVSDDDDVSDDGFNDEESSDEEGIDGPDLARGEGNITSSSEEEECDEATSSKDNDEFDHNWAELDKDVEETDDLSRRLAVCNMDWDRIKAQDIFVLLNSFKPAGGFIKSVTIYPSEYGLQRMEEERMKGPLELVEAAKAKASKTEENIDKGNNNDDKDDDDDDNEEDAEGSSYHREKLRQYQLNRLKYYYAVVELDSIDTANQIYTECDGMEYESSSTRLDLRFIPDDMTFDQSPKDVCSEMPLGGSYKPSSFFTSALSQSKVNLTWDETDQDRVKITMRAPSKKEEVTEEDFKAYLASDSDGEGESYGDLVAEVSDEDEGVDDDDDDDEEEEAEDKQIEKYKQLLQNIQETENKKDDRDIEMEVTWEPGLKEVTENLVKKKAETENATPWEQYLLKKKEKRKKKKDEHVKKAKKTEMEEDERKDSKLKKKKKQHESEGNREDEPDIGHQAFSDDEIDVETNDPFFKQDLLSDEDEAEKKRKEKKSLKKKKKKRKNEKLTEEEEEKKEKEKAELSLLMMDEEEEEQGRHFNLKNLIDENKNSKRKKKKKQKLQNSNKSTEDDDFKIDVKDERFTAMYTSHLYNIDPSAPEFKKTKAMEALVEEKIHRKLKTDSKGANSDKNKHTDFVSKKHKRKHEKLSDDIDSEQTSSAKISRDVVTETESERSIEALVKSVKAKTQRFHIKSKMKT